MKNTFLLLSVSLAVLSAHRISKPQIGHVWLDDLDVAERLARENGKPILAVFR